MEAAHSSKTLIITSCQTTHCHVAEGGNLQKQVIFSIVILHSWTQTLRVRQLIGYKDTCDESQSEMHTSYCVGSLQQSVLSVLAHGSCHHDPWIRMCVTFISGKS
jgi:hypothetical protein